MANTREHCIKLLHDEGFKEGNTVIKIEGGQTLYGNVGDIGIINVVEDGLGDYTFGVKLLDSNIIIKGIALYKWALYKPHTLADRLADVDPNEC